MSDITLDIVTRAAEEEAAQAAFRKSAIESWTLYAIGVTATILRTYARGSAVGFRHLRADDYLIWVGIVRVPDGSQSAHYSTNTDHSSYSTPRRQLSPIAWAMSLMA